MSQPAPASSRVASTTSAGQSALMGTYARQDVMFERGEGAWLISTTGDRYLDFTSGIAVNSLGHANPTLTAALTEQAGKLWHTSNLFRIPGQERLGERLVAATFADRVFFCNSGTEAIEGSIKLARRHHHVAGHPERYRIITFKGAFHGRTLAALAAAGNEKYLDGYGPQMPGFDVMPTMDMAAVEAAISPETAAIMVEPVQGEGGIRVMPPADLKHLRKLCDDNGLLLIVDEVQCGVGRTGKLFAHEWAGITPDIMAIAKGIGGGFPLGAFLATEDVAKVMSPGTHGTTFGGNPLAMAVGNAVLDVILEPGFLEAVQTKGLRLKQDLARIKDENPDVIEEIRGVGLLLGIKMKQPVVVGDVQKACTAEKLLTVTAGENVLRVLPPLTVTDADLAEFSVRLSKALRSVPPPNI